MYPDVPLFNCVDTFTIQGKIETAHFQAAFRKLIAVTDALRTIFLEVGGSPEQVILGELDYDPECLDFSGERCPRESFDRWLERRRQCPIDITKRSFDSALVKISEREFVGYLGLHHIIGDGWTFFLLLKRMSELLGALSGTA